jgi:hypothetical protein
VVASTAAVNGASWSDTRLRPWQTLLLAIPSLAAVACLARSLGFLIWTTTRALDLTDEGFYFMSVRYPHDVTMTSTSFGLLLRPLFWIVRWDIASFRVAGFALTVLSAFVLTAGLEACRRRLDPIGSRSWTYIVAAGSAIAAASLLGYSMLLTTPSYNSLTNWGLLCSGGLVFAVLARDAADRTAMMFAALAGAALAIVFFAKFSAAISSGGMFALVMLAWPLTPLRVRMRWIASAALGGTFVSFVFFVSVQSPAEWLRLFRLGLWSATTQSPLHGTGAFERYYVSWRDDLVVEWLKENAKLLYATAALAVPIWFAPAGGWIGRSLRLLAWAALGCALYRAVLHARDYPPALYQYDVVRLFFGWLLLLVPLALAWRRRPPASGSQLPATGFPLSARDVQVAWVLVVLALFALPFCGAVGTGLPLQYGMRYTLGAWFGLFAIVLARLSAPARVRWTEPTGLAILAGFAAVYLVRGPSEAPYRLLTPIAGQTEVTPIGPTPGVTLKLDPVLHAFIMEVRKAAADTGFTPGDDILGFHDMPGVVYALGGRSPGMPWFTMGYPGSRVVMERGLALADRERLQRAYILQVKSSTGWLQSLKPYGINFPDDYELGGTFIIPYSWAKEEVKWWRPKRR